MLELGNLVMTQGIASIIGKNKLFENEIKACFFRYVSCDWGDLCEEDKHINNNALVNGERILAKYNTSESPIYIITEWDRSVTTILLTEEY